MAKKRKKAKKSVVATFLLFVVAFVYVLYNKGVFNNFSFSFPTSDNNTTVVTDGNLKVSYLYVGQADSILISNNGKYMLIDAGNKEDGPKLTEYFKSIGISKFDVVVGTHAHEDHIGGMSNIIDNFDIGTYYMPDALSTTKTFENVLDSLTKKKISYTVPKIGDSFTLNDCNFKVLYTGTDTDNLNNSSIVLKMNYGSKSFLFTGDATTEVEKQILNADLKTDVLKVGHHGSSTSSGDSFISKVLPQYAIISVGKNNTYNLPKDSVIKRLEKYSAKVYRTDTDGTIIATSDGINLDITTSDLNLDGN